MKAKLLLSFLTAFLVFPHLGMTQTLPMPDHTVIVILENKSYEQIIGNSTNAPYINHLANGGALFTQFYAGTHPSQPNYLMLFSGSNQGITNNNFPTASPWNMTLPFHTPNMAACLIADGYSFKGYAEGLPSVGYVGVQSGAYASKHAVYSYWQGDGPNTIPASANQPFTSFPSDFNNLPTVSYVIPDAINSMHDGTILQGDTWLENNLSDYIIWANTHNSLFILTFDEGTITSDNRIATIFTGQNVVHGQYSQTLNHYNLLRTIEDIYGICYNTANDSAAVSITSCWNIAIGSTPIIQTSLRAASQNIQIYPNPFSYSTTLLTDIPFIDATLTMYNLYGQKVKQIDNISGKTFTLFRDNLPSGIYTIQLIQNGGIINVNNTLVITD